MVGVLIAHCGLLAIQRGYIAAERPIACGPWVLNKQALESEDAKRLLDRVRLEDPPPQYRLRPRQFSTYQPHSKKGHYEDVLCLFAKRLERGRFVWPQAASGTVSLTRAQLSMLLEGIDWRRPERTWEPQLSV